MEYKERGVIRRETNGNLSIAIFKKTEYGNLVYNLKGNEVFLPKDSFKELIGHDMKEVEITIKTIER